MYYIYLTITLANVDHSGSDFVLVPSIWGLLMLAPISQFPGLYIGLPLIHTPLKAGPELLSAPHLEKINSFNVTLCDDLINYSVPLNSSNSLEYESGTCSLPAPPLAASCKSAFASLSSSERVGVFPPPIMARFSLRPKETASHVT